MTSNSRLLKPIRNTMFVLHFYSMSISRDSSNGAKFICFLRNDSPPPPKVVHLSSKMELLYVAKDLCPFTDQTEYVCHGGPGVRAGDHQGWTREGGTWPHVAEHPKTPALTETIPLCTTLGKLQNTSTSTSESVTRRKYTHSTPQHRAI